MADRARGTIEMDIGGRAPAGVLTGADGRRFGFSGWTELAVVIEQWRQAKPVDQGPREPAAPSGGLP